MPIYWVILATMLATTGILSNNDRLSNNRAEAVDVDTLAYNILIYRNALAEYAHANPNFTGVPADSALPLPTWFNKYPYVSGYVSAGQSFTYYPAPPNGLVSRLVDISQSQAIGTVVANSLQSPSAGNVGVVVPAAIPNGSALAYQ